MGQAEVAMGQELPFGYPHVVFWNVSLTPDQLNKVSADLCVLGTLEVLGLAGKDVDDSWLKALGKTTRTSFLSLESTNITDVGLETLLSWKGLKTVRIKKNPRVTASAVARIARLRPEWVIGSDLD